MNIREPEISQFCTNCLKNCLLGNYQARNSITLGWGKGKLLGKISKMKLILARRLWVLDTLLVFRTKIVQCPLSLEITKRASSRRRTAGGQTDSDQTDSSLPTPNCASCHKKDKELLTLSFIILAYSFILQMLFFVSFPIECN